jgi:hypothetical protein
MKTGPDQQAVKQARDDKRNQPLTVQAFFNAALGAGVTSYIWNRTPAGFDIVLIGGGQKVEVHCPEGHPFATYNAMALAQFRTGDTQPTHPEPRLPPDVPAPNAFAEAMEKIPVSSKQYEATETKRNLGLCKMCEAQPPYAAHADFCGGQCAQKWHVQETARRQGVKL